MKLLIIIVLVLTAGGIAAAQEQTKLVGWKGEPHCGRQVNINNTDILECDGMIVDGHLVRYIYHNGFFLAVSFFDDGDYIVADTYISNASGERMLVNPGKWGIIHYKTIEDREAKDRRDIGVATAIDPGKIAKKIQSSVRWRNALGAFFAGAARSTSSVSSSGRIYDNRGNSATYSGTGTVSGPDNAARARDAQNQRIRNAAAADRAQNVLSTALFANTLLPNENITGLVYFDRNKRSKHGMVIIQMPTGAYLFEVDRK